jgi:hypothetical protein
MDDEVTQIFKKWKMNNALPKKDLNNVTTIENNPHNTTINMNNGKSNQHHVNNETFDSRTFTRPIKRRGTFNIHDPLNNISSLPTVQSDDTQSMESGVSCCLKENSYDAISTHCIIRAN